MRKLARFLSEGCSQGIDRYHARRGRWRGAPVGQSAPSSKLPKNGASPPVWLRLQALRGCSSCTRMTIVLRARRSDALRVCAPTLGLPGNRCPPRTPAAPQRRQRATAAGGQSRQLPFSAPPGHHFQMLVVLPARSPGSRRTNSE